MSINSANYDPSRFQEEKPLASKTHEGILGSVDRLAHTTSAAPLMLGDARVPWFDEVPKEIADTTLVGMIYTVPGLDPTEAIYVAEYNEAGQELAKQALSTEGAEVTSPLGHIGFSYEKPDGKFSGFLTLYPNDITVQAQCFEEQTEPAQYNDPLKDFASKIGLRRVVIAYEAQQLGGAIVDMNGYCSDVEGRDIDKALENYS